MKITNDFSVRGLDAIAGTLEERQKRLKDVLSEEWTYLATSATLDHAGVGAKKALFLLIMQPPCTLHGECRMAIKQVEMCLQEGMPNAVEGKTYADRKEYGETLNVAFIRAVEHVMNTQIFGEPANPGHYFLPVSDDRKKIGPLKFTNVRARKVMNKVEHLVRLCVVEALRVGWWMKALTYYRAALVFILSHKDLRPAEVYEFQKCADLYGHFWLALYGSKGSSNYIHFMWAGHFAEFLFRWGNLYQHSQQGWEAFNSLLKTFYFRRTQRGGYTGGLKSRLRPVGRWLQRRMVWKSNLKTYPEMVQFAEEQRTNRSESDTDSDDESLPSLIVHEAMATGDGTMRSPDDDDDSDDDSFFFV